MYFAWFIALKELIFYQPLAEMKWWPILSISGLNKRQWNLKRNSYIFITKIHLKMSSAKWRPFCLNPKVLKVVVINNVLLKRCSSWTLILSLHLSVLTYLSLLVSQMSPHKSLSVSTWQTERECYAVSLPYNVSCILLCYYRYTTTAIIQYLVVCWYGSPMIRIPVEGCVLQWPVVSASKAQNAIIENVLLTKNNVLFQGR